MVWDNLGVKKDTKKRLREEKLKRQKERGDQISYDDLINDLLGEPSKEENERNDLESVFMKL